MFTKQLKKVFCLLLVVLCFLIGCARPVYATNKIIDVEETLNSLTLYEKICQMFIMYQYKIPNVDNGGYLTATETGDALKHSLEKYPIGGILYNGTSMKSHNQLTNLLSTANSYSKIPLLFPVDEEGGNVARIGKNLGYTRGETLSSMGTYSSEGIQVAYDNARFLGLNIADHGFNLDFAPVADTYSNPNNKVIGNRAYSKDFDEAAKLVSYAVSGFKSAGVGTTLKHFPGHGDTEEDTHTGSAYVHKPLNQLRVEEFKPFRAGIQSGTDAVMIAHLIVDDIGEPSLFSEKLVTDVLQDEMGFEGLIITDGLEMGAVTQGYSTEEIVIKGINSGIDMFLCIEDLPTAVEAVEEAVLNGTITEERINESVRKILTFKQNHQ